jgi:hypothetical protein
MAKEEAGIHKEKINLIVFNPSGTRMVSTDLGGKVAVWRGINCVAQYKK